MTEKPPRMEISNQDYFPLAFFHTHLYSDCEAIGLEPSMLLSNWATCYKHDRDAAMCLSVVLFGEFMGLDFHIHSVLVFPSYFADNHSSICPQLVKLQTESLMSLYGYDLNE